MKDFSAAPQTSEQYWKTPTCFFGSVVAGAAGRPVREGDVLAVGELLPPSSSDVQGAAMNLSRRFVVPANLSAMP